MLAMTVSKLTRNRDEVCVGFKSLTLLSRSRTLREGTRLSSKERHYRLCGGIYSLLGLRDNCAVRAPVAEDGHAGHDGPTGRSAEGMTA
jgi:hypothetical protein